MNLNFERLSLIADIKEWKTAYEEEIHKLDELYQEEERLYYELYTGGSENPRLEEIQKIKHNLMTDEAIIQTLSSWKERLKSDHVWHRRLSVFLSKMKQEALDSHPELVKLQQEIQANLMKGSVEAEGKTYSLGAVHSAIMENPDRELRKQLLLGAQKIGEEQADLFRTLVRKRNELARNAGFENYYKFRCNLKEINYDNYLIEMDKLLQGISEASALWSSRIKEKFGWDEIHHFDQYYSTFNFHKVENGTFTSDRLNTVIKDIISGLGVDSTAVPFEVERIEIPYGGFCLNINPQEIKLVVNMRDSYSVYLSGIHEMGHALDGRFGSFHYPELYRFYSSIAAEGIAELFQTIVTDPEFLLESFDLDKKTLEYIQEINTLTDINMVRINHFYSLVEFEIYKNPERDFQLIADECYLKVFGEKGTAFHPASEMFYVENPAFFQDYNFALGIRDMIRHKYKMKSPYRKAGFFTEFLDEFIKPMQLFSWEDRVQKLCGEPFTFKYLESNLSKNEGLI